MRSKFTAKPGKIERSIDLPHQMIFRNRVAKMKLVAPAVAKAGSVIPRVTRSSIITPR
jgi:hypothetical protein